MKLFAMTTTLVSVDYHLVKLVPAIHTDSRLPRGTPSTFAAQNNLGNRRARTFRIWRSDRRGARSLDPASQRHEAKPLARATATCSSTLHRLWGVIFILHSTGRDQ